MTSNSTSASPQDFDCDVELAARSLIGAAFLVDGVGGYVVETEAYGREDPASHSYTGPNQRNAAMFGTPGTIYVYRSYGIHWCVNIVCRPGEAVLIRALEPVWGANVMRERRTTDNVQRLCGGPGCLTQALGIDKSHDGLSVADHTIEVAFPDQSQNIVSGPRIGISKAIDQQWRFGLLGSRFHSKPFGAKPQIV